MPEAARLPEHPSVAAAAAGPSWSGELHGEVGAMHRAIKLGLLSESFDLAVVPLPVRPGEKLLARMSLAVGWLVLAGAVAGVMATVFASFG